MQRNLSYGSYLTVERFSSDYRMIDHIEGKIA